MFSHDVFLEMTHSELGLTMALRLWRWVVFNHTTPYKTKENKYVRHV